MALEAPPPEETLPARPCPICGRPRVRRFRPFCSSSCRDRDLLAWLDGRYAVPAVEVEDDGDKAPDKEA